MTRRRVLIIAEAANPEWVSVPLVGWSLANALRNVADVHIVTQVRNRDAFLRAGLVENHDFTSIDSEAISRPIWQLGNFFRMGKGKGWTAVTAFASLSYYYFEYLVWKKFKSKILAGEYDVVHRITPLSPTAISPIAAKCFAAKVPFILGPLNGGVPWPKGFATERRREREWLSYVRSVYKFLPGRNTMLKSAAAIIVGSRFTESEIPEDYKYKCFYIPENAIDPSKFFGSSRAPLDGPLRACFIGRLVPYKGPDILLEASLPLLKSGLLALDIIGDGPLRAQLERMVKENSVEESIVFHGWVAHDKIPAIAQRNHVFSFPSVREFGGGAVLEAMALGLVPIIVDYGGPSELVDDDRGFKVPLGSRSSIINSFREILEKLYHQRRMIKLLSNSGQEYVLNNFTWAQKAAQVCAIYEKVTYNDN